ncbi:tetratricopeptide repeat protein [Stenotrophomonas oahuensis]|uniref:Tetratricopeptide repeat protein n=1 Tax=Stenotrophomonas oahuensis TaxID=3003271 RepID=A0ABY9YVQ9_9GAMM|nr:tetratricopeptide repeat protein [Stenotrophomonas sp. A5586]WNH54772.1 tetratricopeptide repeat protein [Stenotrophomonas sp. A5586]
MVNLWLPAFAALAAAVMALMVLWPLRGSGRKGFIALTVALGVAGCALYVLVGTPEAATPRTETAASNDLQQGIRDLQQALEREPQRADGWALLGRSQLALGRTEEANAAFERAVALAPDEAPVLVEAAQARAQAHATRQFDDTALQWLRHAQQVDPNSERAAWLIGVALRQRGQNAEAAQVWEALLPKLEPGAAAALREQIAIARGAGGDAPAAASGGHALQVSVALAAGTKADALPANATVFIIARQPGGPPMPVAVEKHALSDLPITVTLDDGDSPMPTVKLSALDEVEVFARVSASGQANRQEGDVDSAPVRVKLPHTGTVELSLP